MELKMVEQKRLEVIQMIMDERLSILEACKVLGKSERQVYRILKRVREEGITGVVHKNKGRASPRKVSKKTRQIILKLCVSKFRGINDTHLRELLLAKENIKIGRETLRKILREANIKSKQKRRKKKHRTRRERKAAFGMMVQMDASKHDWLEGRGPKLTLILGIDDATNYRWARFERAETTWAYLNLMNDICSTKGIPLSVYNDRHIIFTSPRERTIEEELANKEVFTQFGRALDELGVQMILAYSPQAKGRVERDFALHQDRLVVELRLAKASTEIEANIILKKYLAKINRQFTVQPRQRKQVFVKAPPKHALIRTLCLKARRTVRNDNTISFESLSLQIPKNTKYRSFAKKKVDVLQLQDGLILIEYRNEIIARFYPEEIANMAKDRRFKSFGLDLKVVNY